MTFASANRVELWRVKEVSWGVLPTSPVWKETRFTGESLDDSITTETSKELRADRMTNDLSVVDAEPGGGFNIEMSVDSFDDMIESALMSTWGTPLAITGTDIAAGTTVGSHLTSATASKFAAVETGQFILIAGFVAAGNNGFFRVADKVDDTHLTLDPPPSTIEAAGASVTVSGTTLKNGVTEQSFTFMKRLTDVTSPTRQTLLGQRVTAWALDMQTASLLTGSFTLKGKSATWTDVTDGTPSGETFTAAPATATMNCVQNIQRIYQDGAVLGSEGSVNSMQFNLDNQHRSQKGLGVLGNAGVAAGKINLTINASVYFESKAQAIKFKNATAFSWSFRLIDDVAMKGYIVSLPRCKYESFVAQASGEDTDVMAETTIRALRDPVSGCMLRIDRFSWGP